MARLSADLQAFFLDRPPVPAGLTPSDSPALEGAIDAPNSLPPTTQVTLADLWDLAGERIFGFLFVLLSLPSALPLPAPGYSTPFGVAIVLLALQLIAGRSQPWMPQRWLRYPLPLTQLQKIVKAGLPWLRRLEVVSRPRLTWFCTGLTGRVIIGIAITLMGASMIAPIPGTNTLPAMGIFVVGMGLLDDDGLISLSGVVAGLTVTAAIWIGLIWFGASAIDLLKDMIR